MEQFQRHLGVNVTNLPATDARRDLKSFYGEGKAWTLWDDKEAWRIRETAEGNFYQDLLRKLDVESVIDVSAASGFHVINLARRGFRVAAVDGFEGFVAAGEKNAQAEGVIIPFMHAMWSDLPEVAARLGRFDSAICLGSSLHHTDQVGVKELFEKVGSLLNPSGKFIVEQRNYERLFRERPDVIDHPCGWRYALEYPDSRTVVFHLEDEKRGLNTSSVTTITFEQEIIDISKDSGYALCERYFDYGKHAEREQSWWIQYVFEKFSS